MHVAVCVKQIPDPTAPAALTGEYTLDRTGKLLLDEADTYGVEMALQLVESAGGGEVTLVTMGDAADVSGLRGALAMGASRAIIVSDPSLRNSDALTTAKVLSAVLAGQGADLVLCATESSDGYTGTVPTQLAELLNLPSLTFATRVSIADGAVTIHRQTENGYDEVRATLPVVVTVTAGVVEPRYASFKGIMAAKSKPIDVVNLADLGLAAPTTGQRIESVVVAESRAAGEKFVDDGEGAAKIVAFLESVKVL